MADLRLPALATLVWASVLAARFLPGLAVLVVLVVPAMALARAVWKRQLTPTGMAWALATVAVAAVVLLELAAVARSPVAALARDRATVHAVFVVRSDPVRTRGRFGDQALFRASLRDVTGRGARRRVRAPVLVLGDVGWLRVPYGARVVARGRLEPAGGADLAGVLVVAGTPEVLIRPPGLWRLAGGLRAGIRDAAGGRSAARALVPALVDGDEADLAEGVRTDFRTTGLTHLLAVSGTNLTIVVGALLVLARGLGVRARGLLAVGACGVAGFVLLARAEPSVLRAAAMGSVGLLGMGSGGRARGARTLGAAVIALLVFDPWLATSPGFALSTAATAGIVLLAPGWRDALARWLPRWAAEAVSVPLAAQLACTPLIAALSGQVSLVAVAANLLVATAVGPATVLGLLGGVTFLVCPWLGRLAAQPAVWCADWIVTVARHGAALPMAAGDVSTSTLSITVLTGLCLVAAVGLGAVLARRSTSVGVCALLVLAILVPLPSIGWPPRGWLLVACDVGQGDGLVLRAGPESGVVVDTGPDPPLMDRCLRRLGVRRVPLVVLTHFHADHVDGLAGVLRGRPVGGIEVGPFDEPSYGVDLVRGLAAQSGVPVVTAGVGESRTVGQLHWQVLAAPAEPPADSDSPPNDASIVLLVQTRGVRLLLMGDEEIESQERLAATYPGLHADVLKVAHHGSAKQDPALVESLGARLGVISVGVDNDYGHPAPSCLRLLHHAGMLVRRTDTAGDVAVVLDHGLRVVGRGARRIPP